MSAKKPPDLGRKNPLLYKPINVLHLDSLNPRLPETAHNRSEDEVLKIIARDFYIEELARSMAKNGYFDEEPLVVVPRELPKKYSTGTEFKGYIEKNSTHFVVVEGNRRLSAARLLLDADSRQALNIRGWPEIDASVRADLSQLPVIVYKKREEVIPYLGVRHITGIKKWDSYPKAYYLADLVKNQEVIEELELQTGDKQGSTRKSIIAFYILRQAQEEFDYDIDQAKEDFSFLILSLGQGPVKNYLGLPKRIKDISLSEPIPQEKMGELKDFLSWIFGEGRQKKRVIEESRDITNYLAHVLRSPEATQYLKTTRDLRAAYDLTDGEEAMLMKLLANASVNLERALGIAHRHKTDEVKAEIKKCQETIRRLLLSVKARND